VCVYDQCCFTAQLSADRNSYNTGGSRMGVQYAHIGALADTRGHTNVFL